MKFLRKQPGFLWQAIIVFLIILDSILLSLSIISNLRPLSLEYIAVFDLVVSIILFILFIFATIRIKEKVAYFKSNWILIFSFIPIYLIAFLTGLIDFLIIIKLLNIIKIFSLYLFAQKFAKQVIKYQEKTRLVYALSIFLVVLFFCSFVFFLVEHPVNPEVSTYEDSLWFILQTITTVGYGDIIPITGIGRIMGVISMFSALALTSIITSVATFSLIEKFRKGTEELTKNTKERVENLDNKLDDINNQLEKFKNFKAENLEKDIKEIRTDIENIKELLKDIKEN